MKLRQLVLLILCAALAFGGSFTCKGSTGDDHDKNDDDKNERVSSD